MHVAETALPGVRLVTPKRHGDHRGWFSETYNRQALAEIGIDCEFVQDNHSYSAEKGTIRGLHLQAPPFAQDKLVRVARGSVFDVAVDLRVDSAHFGRWVSATLDAAEGVQIFVPAGFGHGFCTLETHTEVIYKVSNPYSPAHERGVAWNDSALGIAWPVAPEDAIVASRDRQWPDLSAYKAGN